MTVPITSRSHQSAPRWNTRALPKKAEINGQSEEPGFDHEQLTFRFEGKDFGSTGGVLLLNTEEKLGFILKTKIIEIKQVAG